MRAPQWVLSGNQMWMAILVYWTTRIMIRAQIAEEKHLPPLNGLPIIGSFLSFFLVFYAGQAYTRFNSQYFTSMSCEGRIFDICSMAYSSLDRSAAIRLWRHINLAHALAYVGLSPAYTVKNFLEPVSHGTVIRVCTASDPSLSVVH